MTLPPLPSTIGKRGQSTYPLGDVERFVVVDEVRRKLTGYPNILVFQRIRYDEGNEELRLGYYVIGKTGRMKGKWCWGQYAAIGPASDFQALVKMATEKGWIGKEEQPSNGNGKASGKA
jgi:hypothetical protein